MTLINDVNTLLTASIKVYHYIKIIKIKCQINSYTIEKYNLAQHTVKNCLIKFKKPEWCGYVWFGYLNFVKINLIIITLHTYITIQKH